jgi:hypothetical protein
MIKKDSNEYDVFYLFYYESYKNDASLYRSTIKINKDSVYLVNNEIMLDSSNKLQYSIITIPSSQKEHIWVIVKSVIPNKFHKFHINTKNNSYSLSTQLFSGNYPQVLENYPINLYFSNKQGTKIAFVYRYPETYSFMYLLLYDFDRCTGLLKNEKIYNISNINDSLLFIFLSGIFSPDGSKLYINGTRSIYQIDLNTSQQTPVLIWQSPQVASNDYTLNSLSMKRSIDNKIYVPFFYGFGGFAPPAVDTSNYLGVIEYPDSAGLACGFKLNGLYVGKKNKRYLPTTESTWATDPWYPVPLSSFTAGRDTAVCGGAAVPLGYVGPDTLTYVWEPAAGLSCTACPNPVATADTTTRYRLHIFDPDDFCQVPAPDSVLITVLPRTVLTATLPPDTAICPGAVFTLTPTLVGTGSVLWSTGATTPSITVEPTATTTYTLTYSGTACDVPDTATVTVTVLPPDASPCRTTRLDETTAQIRIYPNPTTGPLTVELPAGIRTDIDLLNAIGQGLLRVVNRSGTVHLDLTPYPDGHYYLMVKGQRTRVVLRK